MKSCHLVAVLILVLNSGCATTMYMKGNGPRPYPQTVLCDMEPFHGIDEALASPDVQKLKPGQATFMNSFWKMLGRALVLCPVRQVIAGRNEDDNVVVVERNYWYPILFIRESIVKYTEDGRPIQRWKTSTCDPFAILYMRRHITQPQEESTTRMETIWGMTQMNADQTQMDSLAYDDKNAWITLFGLFGMGDINGRKYAQIFWIPFPVERRCGRTGLQEQNPATSKSP